MENTFDNRKYIISIDASMKNELQTLIVF